jgi:hypothetical protein
MHRPIGIFFLGLWERSTPRGHTAIYPTPPNNRVLIQILPQFTRSSDIWYQKIHVGWHSFYNRILLRMYIHFIQHRRRMWEMHAALQSDALKGKGHRGNLSVCCGLKPSGSRLAAVAASCTENDTSVFTSGETFLDQEVTINFLRHKIHA